MLFRAQLGVRARANRRAGMRNDRAERLQHNSETDSAVNNRGYSGWATTRTPGILLKMSPLVCLWPLT
jgi:hypothetical protein